MGAMNLFEKSLEDAGQMSREAFGSRYRGLYLKGFVPETDDEGEPGFFTGVISEKSLKRMLEEARALDDPGTKTDKPVVFPGPFVVEIAKHEVNSWASWVSVGRAENNDIAFLHSSISKLHARFHVDEESEGPRVLLVTDMGSKLGTSLNGKLLERSRAEVISPGDSLRFGEIDSLVLDGPNLYDRLVTPSFARGSTTL